MSLQRIIHYLLLAFLFLLPWQSRFVYQPAFLNDGFWEYGSLTWYATEALLWIVIILSFISLIQRRKEWQPSNSKKVYWIISLLVIGYLILEIFHSLNADISFQFVFRLLGAACLAVVVLSVAKPLSALSHPPRRAFGLRRREESPPPLLGKGEGRERSRWYLLIALWTGGVVQGLLALWQFLSQKIIHFPFSGIALHFPQDLGAFVIQVGDQRWLRAYGAFGSPNILGGYLAVTWLIGLLVPAIGGSVSPRLELGTKAGGYLSYLRRGVWPYALVIGQMIITTGLILSFSRAAWLATVVGVLGVIASLAQARRGDPSNQQISMLGDCRVPRRCGVLAMTARPLLFSAAIVIILFLVFQPLFLVRAKAVGRLEQQSLTTRAEQLTDFKKIFWPPLLTKEGVGGGLPRLGRALLGVGPGAYTLALYKQNPNLPVWRYQPIHNIYLLMLAEIGLVGFAVVFLFSCFLVFWTWQRNRLFLPVLISLSILGLFDHWLWSMYAGVIVWGAIIGLSTDQAA